MERTKANPNFYQRIEEKKERYAELADFLEKL
jgi:hypothetical protein